MHVFFAYHRVRYVLSRLKRCTGSFCCCGQLFVCASVQRLSAPTAARIVRQVCSGVKQLHGRGVCHRDIRTANVLVKAAESLLLKMTDFGFSCPLPAELPEAPSASSTGTGPCFSFSDCKLFSSFRAHRRYNMQCRLSCMHTCESWTLPFFNAPVTPHVVWYAWASVYPCFTTVC